MITHTHRHISGVSKECTVYLDDESGADREDEEMVVLTVFEPIPGKSDGGEYIAFHDDSGEQVTYLASQIDDLIEALTQLKEEL